MRDYELVYIVSPQVVDDGLTGIVDRVSQFISSRGGQIDRVDVWGKRRLAYPIGPFREGTYMLALFKMDPSQAADLENSLRTSEEIIRHLVIRLDEAQVRQRQQQLAQQQEREEQERLRREQAAAQAAQAALAAQEAAAQEAAAQEASAAQEDAPQPAPQEAVPQAQEEPAAEATEEPAVAREAPQAGPETS